MPLVTRSLSNVGDPLVAPDGTAYSGKAVTFTLVNAAGSPVDAWDATSGERVVGQVVAVTNSTGEFTVAIWPNTRGDAVTQYLCQVDVPGAVNFQASVDAGGSTLQWITFKAAGTAIAVGGGGYGAFATDVATTTGLTYGYTSGIIRIDNTSTAVASSTVALTANILNYVEVTSGGTVSANTTAFTTGRFPMATVLTGASTITTITDKRGFAAIGLAGAPGAPGTTDHTALSNVGTRTHAQLETDIAGKQTALGFTPENAANKATDFTTANNTLYPSVLAVKTYADGLVVGLLDDRGSYDASVNTFPASGGSGTAGAVLKGDLWYISVAGTLGGVLLNIGDSVRALADTPGQTAASWSVLESNIGFVPENAANKDASGGYAGLTLFALNLKNAANTFTNFFTNATTAARTWTMPNKSGTVAMLDDITGTNSNTNTGDQTSAVSTGIISGGLLSVGSPNTTFSVTAGTGVITNNTVIPPTVTQVSWSAQNNVTATQRTLGLVSYVAIDSAGAAVQQLAEFTNAQHRQYIILGSLIHVNSSTLDAVNQFSDVATSPANQVSDLSEALGRFNIAGNIFSANGANLNINKSAGTVFSHGSNWANNTSDPNKLTLASLVALSFQYRFSTGTNGVTGIAINPNIYDLNGVSTAVATNKHTVQRIYSFVSNNVKIQPGQTEYNSMAEAKASIQTQVFVTEPSIAANGILRGFLVIKQGTTSLQNAVHVFFYEAGKFSQQVGIGGQSVSTMQNAYDNSIDPEVTTDATRGAVSIKRGSAADTDNIIEGQNGAGTTTFNVTGAGVVAGSNLSGTNTGDNPGVTSVTGTAPIVSSGGSTPAISIPAATAAVAGHLTASDWVIFNAKQAIPTRFHVTADTVLTYADHNGAEVHFNAAIDTVATLPAISNTSERFEVTITNDYRNFVRIRLGSEGEAIGLPGNAYFYISGGVDLSTGHGVGADTMYTLAQYETVTFVNDQHESGTWHVLATNSARYIMAADKPHMAVRKDQHDTAIALKANLTANSFTGLQTLSSTALNEARSDVAQHATTMDFWAAAVGNVLDGTGSALTITGIANAPQAGARRDFYPLTGTVLTQGATFAIDGAVSRTSVAGEVWTFVAKSTTTYRVFVRKVDGTAVVATASSGQPYYPTRQWCYWRMASAAATTLAGVGVTAPAAIGAGVAASAQADTSYVSYTSAATNNSAAGVVPTGSSYVNTQARYRPKAVFLIRTDSAITTRRIWCAITSADLSLTDGTGALATRYVGIRFTSSGNFQICSGDGTTGSAEDTGIAVVADTAYLITVDWSVSGTLSCTINGTTVTKTTYLDSTGTTALGLQCILTTLDANARVHRVAFVHLEHN